jgi:hypothetical protein
MPHFFGELTKTEMGCDLIRRKQVFAQFANGIRNHQTLLESPESLLILKGYLWAVVRFLVTIIRFINMKQGHIGASSKGLMFLEEEKIVEDIVYLAQSSAVLSLKGLVRRLFFLDYEYA